jgi:hypothetical protein
MPDSPRLDACHPDLACVPIILPGYQSSCPQTAEPRMCASVQPLRCSAIPCHTHSVCSHCSQGSWLCKAVSPALLGMSSELLSRNDVCHPSSQPCHLAVSSSVLRTSSSLCMVVMARHPPRPFHGPSCACQPPGAASPANTSVLTASAADRCPAAAHDSWQRQRHGADRSVRRS